MSRISRMLRTVVDGFAAVAMATGAGAALTPLATATPVRVEID